MLKYESIIYEANDVSTYLYRSYDDLQIDSDFKGPVSLVLELKNPLYVFLLNNDEVAYIGKPITYKYYEIYITANKEYITKKIVLIFNFDWSIFLDYANDKKYYNPSSKTIKTFQQVVIFPDV